MSEELHPRQKEIYERLTRAQSLVDSVRQAHEQGDDLSLDWVGSYLRDAQSQLTCVRDSIVAEIAALEALIVKRVREKSG